MPVFLLPDLGEGLTEADIVTWLVEEGDAVVIDQPIVEVETAKAAVEVPVPYAGIIVKRHGTAGSSLTVGSPLVEVQPIPQAGEEQPPPEVATPGATGFREPGVVTSAMPEDEGSGNVLIGYGTSTAPRRRRSGRRPAPAAGADAAAGTNGSTGNGSPAGRSPAVISPLVRRLIKERGLDLADLTGSGPGGVIRRKDVELTLSAAPEQASRPAEEASGSAEGIRRIQLRGIRKTIADKLSRSRREIPEATVWVDVDATELLATRRLINAGSPESPVSLIALVARFAVAGLARFPELNARIVDDEILVSDAVGLGFAAQTERGLMVPVVPDAHTLSTTALSAALGDRTARGRAGTLSPTDLSGGTFTVNNYGVFGVDGSAAIINHPEVAILGIGRIIDRPWVVDGQVTVRSISQLTLAFDHRACDGGTAGGFLRYVADCVEAPVRALADL